jgi:alkylation response protein AidB-like acyl-CoA dehydrogenase
MAAAPDDELRQLRQALRGTLGVDDDAAPAPRDEWRPTWPALAELGVTAFCVPEDRGGFGRRVDAAVVTAMELGAALHPSPFAGISASAHALAQTANRESDELLAALLTGEQICAFGRLDATGTARAVDGAPEADALLLDDPGADDLLLLTDRSAWTVATAPHPFDVSRRDGDVTVDPSRGRRVPGTATVRDLHRLLLAADAVGCVQRVLDRTVAYAGLRHAFGRPIGGFQAVQHRLADHSVRARGMALAVTHAARLLGDGAPRAPRAVVVAELSVSSGATHVLHDLLQLTGAIGFTWEYGLHFHERRAHQDARLAANPRAAARRLASSEGWSGGR